MDADAIIVGSGPAGVSAAFPLLQAGLRVLMVDGGGRGELAPPAGPLLEQRSSDESQWRWMIGDRFQALANADAVSPKLRVPSHGHVFEGFAAANRIDAPGFIVAGSLARGGLSNAWGCGVAKLTPEELEAYPCDPLELERSYETVARRIGLSGAADDDLAAYFGVDPWAGPPVPLDSLHAALLARYARTRSGLKSLGFRLGRSRLAVLTREQGDRRACDLSGTCLWGCHRRSLYSATEDLSQLMRMPNFDYRPGWVVESIGDLHSGMRQVNTRHEGGPARLCAPRVLLAAGTLASTRLVLAALRTPASVPLQSCPTAAFLLWLPGKLGRPHERTFGLGQLSFSVALPAGVTAFGSLFATTGIPVAEFVRHMPLARRTAADVLAGMLSSCVVGNLFLPGDLSDARLTLQSGDRLLAQGRYRPEVAPLMERASGSLRRAFRALGAWMLPGSFTLGKPGSDIHYASSLPMQADPLPGQTDALGEPGGLPGIHVVDGACLPNLPEKSHTLTIMANADRIGRRIAADTKRQG